MSRRFPALLAACCVLSAPFLPWGGGEAGYRWLLEYPQRFDTFLVAMEIAVALGAVGVTLFRAAPPLFGVPAAALLLVAATRAILGFGVPGATLFEMTTAADFLHAGVGFHLAGLGTLLLAVAGNLGSPHLFRILGKIDDVVFAIEKGIITLSLGVMVLLVFLDLLLREVAGSGIGGAQKLALYLMLWAGFLGASIATRGGKHLSMDLLDKLLSSTPRRYLQGGVFFVTAAFSFFLSRVGLIFVLQNRAYGDPPLYYGIPEWGVQTVIPLSLFVMGCRFLARSVRVFRHGPEVAEGLH
ncbi:MAG: TRAP transporter small permease [Deltaproteobacteria bacterium]|nr:MAG: TRAP transporter small permease [Deltaproteobacteria bacterium]